MRVPSPRAGRMEGMPNGGVPHDRDASRFDRKRAPHVRLQFFDIATTKEEQDGGTNHALENKSLFSAVFIITIQLCTKRRDCYFIEYTNYNNRF